jgi:hypothetical protein
MSDVVVNVVESATNVTVTEQDVAVDVTENVVEVSVSTAGIQGPPGANNDPTYVTVRNATGATLAKGTIVYISGANGNNVQVTPAIATSDATSARTLGWLSQSIANNGSGLCMVEGYLEGLNTQSFNAGDQLYLSGTVAGGFTATKPQAPIHLVYVGVVTKKSAGDGHVFVKVQNGYELNEIHDVQITSIANNDVIKYDSATSLWKNVNQSTLSVGTAVYAVNSGTAVYSTTSGTALTITGDITKSQVSDFTSGTVTSASTAQQAGTAVYAVNSGTAVSISGDIAQSQVTDLVTDLAAKANLAGGNAFTGLQAIVTPDNATSGLTVRRGLSGQTANIFGVKRQDGNDYFYVGGGGVTVAQATLTTTNTQVGGGVSFLATTGFAGSVPAVVRGAASQTANLLELQNSAASVLAQVTSGGSIQSSANVTAGTLTALARLTVVNGDSGVIGAVVRGAVAQSADLQQWQLSNGSVPISVNGQGELSTGYFFTRFGGGGSSSGLVNVHPSTNIVALAVRGAVSQSSDLQQWQNSGGTVLSLVNSSGSFRVASIGAIAAGNAALTPGGDTNGFLLATVNAGNKGLVIRGAASQTANLQDWQESSGGIPTYVNSFGGLRVRAYTNSFPFSALGVASAAPTEIAVIVRGVANQAEDLTEWQNSAGTVLGGVNPIGQSYFGSATPLQGQGSTAINTQTPTGTTDITITTGTNHGILVGQTVVISGVTPAGYNGTWVAKAGTTGTTLIVTIGSNPGAITVAGAVTVNAAVSITPSSNKNTALVIRQAAGQAYNLVEIQNSSGSSQLTVTPTGGLLSYQANQFQTFAPAVIPLKIIGAASQTANLLSLQRSDATEVMRVRDSGQIGIGSLITATNFAINLDTVGGASAVGAVIRGAASQTADLLQVQNSAGSVTHRVDANGFSYTTGILTLNGLATLSEESSGGRLRLTKMSTTATSPGANVAKLYLRDGTVPGTLKLVVRAGAAGAETTILDNIPQ